MKDFLSFARAEAANLSGFSVCVCLCVCVEEREHIHELGDLDSSVIKTYNGRGAGNRVVEVRGVQEAAVVNLRTLLVSVCLCPPVCSSVRHACLPYARSCENFTRSINKLRPVASKHFDVCRCVFRKAGKHS